MSRILDGVDDYGEAVDSPSLRPATAITMVQWLKTPTQDAQWRAPFEKPYGVSGSPDLSYSLLNVQAGAGRIGQYLTLSPNNVPHDEQPVAYGANDLAWYLFVGRWESGGTVSIRCYNADGTQRWEYIRNSGATYTGSIVYDTTSVFIGRRRATTSVWKGKVGVTALYEARLTDAQTDSLAAGSHPLNVGTPNACWDLRTAGSTDEDLSANANTITWTGTTFDSTDNPPVEAAPTAGTNLVINDITHAQSLDSPAVTQQHQLAANDITHAQILDSPTLSTVADLVINDVSHSQTLDSATLTQVHSLSVQDISQSQTLDPVVLTTEDSLVVADVSHGQTLDAVSLTQVHTLSIAELTHAQSLDSVTITTQQDLVIADLSHGQTLDSVTLSTEAVATYAASAVILLQAQIPIEATIIDGNLDNSVSIIAGEVSASDTVEAAVTASSQVDASVIPNSEVQATVKQSDQLEAELL